MEPPSWIELVDMVYRQNEVIYRLAVDLREAVLSMIVFSWEDHVVQNYGIARSDIKRIDFVDVRHPTVRLYNGRNVRMDIRDAM